MIEVKHVNKSFGQTQVLHDISTKFDKGKVNLIIGQSGHGKTVLAKCIVGLHAVDSRTTYSNSSGNRYVISGISLI